jgi:hypothetical protein
VPPPAIRKADAAVAAAIEARIRVGNTKAVEALRQLINWVPEDKFPLKKGAHGEGPEELKRLRHAPFCCEGYTYALMGKLDARSFLGHLGAIAKALGIEEGWRDLRGDAHE